MTRATTFLLLLEAAAGLLAQTPDCPGFTDCLYSSGRAYGFQRATLRVTYTDVIGLPRTVEFTARIPIGRSGPMAVVIWAHGGGEGLSAPNASHGALSVWSEISAEAGYLAVSPAFHARENEDRQALCQYLSYPEGPACDNFSTVGWDRPFDMRAVIDELERQNQSGPLQGRIDLARIAVAGHSAGSTGVLTVGGAGRQFRDSRYGPSVMSDPRPKAVVALSPAGPATHGLYDQSFNDETTSWSTVDRPTLTVTGLGDAHENAPHLRRLVLDYLPPGDKYRLWINDVRFGHGAYGDDLETCGDGVTQRSCEAFKTVLVSTVLAFLDAYIEGRPQARTYIENDYVARIFPGLIEWAKK